MLSPTKEGRSDLGATPSPSIGVGEAEPVAIDVLELTPVGNYRYRLLIICGMSFMSDAMEVSLLSFLSICARGWTGTCRTVRWPPFVGILVGNLF